MIMEEPKTLVCI